MERYGYDTKFAMHALRLGFEGIELMTSRQLTLPVEEPNLTVLRDVRGGKITQAQVLALITDVETQLSELVDRCTWESERAVIDALMVRLHIQQWEETR